jgi:hypothetical protein
MKLTHSQQRMITAALLLAADTYDHDAITARWPPQGETPALRIAAQFRLQATEARQLAAEISNADYIKVEP